MRKIIFTAFLVMSSFGLFAQPVPPPTGGGNNGHSLSGDQQGAPFDGGLSILLFLGVAYGAKEIYFIRKEKNVKNNN